MATLTAVSSGLFLVITALLLHCCLCDRPDDTAARGGDEPTTSKGPDLRSRPR